MLRLTGQRRRRRGDRGAVTTLVAVLLAGNVLLGMAALAVDVGLLYVEREELQSGADAAALAVAKVCATDRTACDPAEMQEEAAKYASGNAKDEKSDVAVCGRVPDPGGRNLLPECPAPSGNLTDCLGERPTSPYVEVRTSTRLRNGSTALPPAFAGAVTGTDGVTVAACARVGWGETVATAPVLALTVPICTFHKGTAHGGLHPPPDRDSSGGVRFPAIPTAAEVALAWEAPDGEGCVHNGREMPDGAGWLAGSNADCSVTVSVDRWYDGRPSQNTPTGCADRIRDSYYTGNPLTVAIFDRADEPGHRGDYRVYRIVGFMVTGWEIRGAAWPPPRRDEGPEYHHTGFCVSPGATPYDFCVYGYFTPKLHIIG